MEESTGGFDADGINEAGTTSLAKIDIYAPLRISIHGEQDGEECYQKNGERPRE